MLSSSKVTRGLVTGTKWPYSLGAAVTCTLWIISYWGKWSHKHNELPTYLGGQSHAHNEYIIYWGHGHTCEHVGYWDGQSRAHNECVSYWVVSHIK